MNPRLSQLKAEFEERKRQPNTPYRAEAFEKYLKRHGLFNKHPAVVDGLRNGFDLGISPISSTVVLPNNDRSIERHLDGYQAIVDNEFAKGRYLGPHPRRIIEFLLDGPFQTAPLSIKPKPNRPGKFRAIHDYSRGRASINAGIDSDDFPTTWGTFEVVSRLIYTLPPGSQGSIRDVSEAYRTVPARPDQWPGLVVKLRGNEFAINTQNNFGLTSGGGAYGMVADAGLDIFRANGIGPVTRWVDDHLFIRIPKQHLVEYNQKRRDWHARISKNGGAQDESGKKFYRMGVTDDYREEVFDEDCRAQLRDLSSASPRSAKEAKYSYSSADIDRLSEELGYPWEPSKTIEFADEVQYVGWLWKFSTKEVAFPKDKKDEYLAAIRDTLDDIPGSLTDTRLANLHGRLEHTCQVLGPEGRAYLTTIIDIRSALSRRAPLEPFVDRIRQDLQWWINTLSPPRVARKVVGSLSLESANIHCGTNSSSRDVSVVYNNKRNSWRLVTGWDADGPDVAHAIAFNMAAVIASQRPRPGSAPPGPRLIRVYALDMKLVKEWKHGASRNVAINGIFRHIHELSRQKNIRFDLVHFPSKDSPITRGPFSVDTSSLIDIPVHLNRFIRHRNASSEDVAKCIAPQSTQATSRPDVAKCVAPQSAQVTSRPSTTPSKQPPKPAPKPPVPPSVVPNPPTASTTSGRPKEPPQDNILANQSNLTRMQRAYVLFAAANQIMTEVMGGAPPATTPGPPKQVNGPAKPLTKKIPVHQTPQLTPPTMNQRPGPRRPSVSTQASTSTSSSGNSYSTGNRSIYYAQRPPPTTRPPAPRSNVTPSAPNPSQRRSAPPPRAAPPRVGRAAEPQGASQAVDTRMSVQDQAERREAENLGAKASPDSGCIIM